MVIVSPNLRGIKSAKNTWTFYWEYKWLIVNIWISLAQNIEISQAMLAAIWLFVGSYV